MKKAKWLVTALSMLAFGAGAAFAEDRIDLELTADFFSKYVWRGQNLVDDSVFQPGLSASYGGITAGIWGSMELTNVNGNNDEFTEVDYSLDYSSDIPRLSGIGYSVGLIYYDFPNTKIKETIEVYLGLNFDLPASPSITCYYDLDEAEGMYVSLAAGHSIENIVEFDPEVPVGMDISAGFGWGSSSYNKYYWGINQSELNDFVLSASFPIEVIGSTVDPTLNYVTLLSDEIRDIDAYGNDSDFFFVGVSFSRGF